MGRRSPHRRLTPVAARLAALLLVVAGCAPAPPTALPAGHLAERLSRALTQEREQEFLDNFSADADASADGRQWFAVLRDARPAISQPGDRTLLLRTTQPGDLRAGDVTLAVELDATGRIRSVEPGAGRPIWVLGRVDVTRAVQGTVLSAGLDAAARKQWADRLDRAVAAVVAARPPAAEQWTRGLVVEVPAGGADFTILTDESPDSASAITSCGTGTPRIVVNPVILQQPAEWLDSTLVHEAVHVATQSPCRAGQKLPWAVEGLAESVAAHDDPATASRNHELVADYLRDHPVPAGLPTDLSGLTGYALAQVAVDQLRAGFGPSAREVLARAVGDGEPLSEAELRRATSLYRAELERRAASA